MLPCSILARLGHSHMQPATIPRWCSALLGCLAVVGCQGDPSGPLDTSWVVGEFVSAQSLPGVVETSVVRFPGYEGAVFTVSLGERVWCGSANFGTLTCPQWGAIGLWGLDRIGWLKVGAPDSVVDPSS